MMSPSQPVVTAQDVNSYVQKYRAKQQLVTQALTTASPKLLAHPKGRTIIDQLHTTRGHDDTLGLKTDSSSSTRKLPAGEEKYMYISLPKLSEAELGTPLGASLGPLVGLLASLQQRLLAQRQQAADSPCVSGLEA
jgi:hypothetical protein